MSIKIILVILHVYRMFISNINLEINQINLSLHKRYVILLYWLTEDSIYIIFLKNLKWEEEGSGLKTSSPFPVVLVSSQKSNIEIAKF